MSSRWLLPLAFIAGCSFADDAQREIDKNAVIAAEKQGIEAAAAMDALVARGVRAMPAVETSLQAARPAGKKNLIVVLRRIGDAEAAPLLGHIATYDPSEDVRREARFALEGWARDTAAAARAEAAKRALRSVDEISNRNEAG